MTEFILGVIANTVVLGTLYVAADVVLRLRSRR